MIKKCVYCGLIASVAIVVSSLERLIPLNVFIPLPGIKLGLANAIVLFALVKLGFLSAFSVAFCKTIVVSMLFTGFTSFVYSFFGSVLALIVMFILLRYDKAFSIIGVSVGGAAFFNIGQIIAASLILDNNYILYYLPILLLIAVFTGIVVGYITHIMLKNIKIG